MTGDGMSLTGDGSSLDVDLDLVAASLRSSGLDLETFVEVLADKLVLALPRRVKIDRRGLRARRVARIEVTFGEERYVLTSDHGSVETQRARTVRGVALKTEPLRLEAWIDGLARGLAVEAQTSEQSRLALDQLLRG